MKVFLSWSGQYSNDVACCFERWMPCVLQSIDTFISSGDIKAGERWQNRISNALNDIDFGVIFISEKNKDKPWIMFETGALAKNLGVSRVVPVLCDSAEISFVGSPLLQFQYVKLEREGVFSLMESIRESLGEEDTLIDRNNFEKIFDVWWPILESELENISEVETTPKQKTSAQNERLDRIESALSELLRESKRTNSVMALPVSTYRLDAQRIVDGFERKNSRTPPAREVFNAVKTVEQAKNALTFLKEHKPEKIALRYTTAILEKYPNLEGE